MKNGLEKGVVSGPKLEECRLERVQQWISRTLEDEGKLESILVGVAEV